MPTDSAALANRVEPPTVEVRDFSWSTTVAIVAWSMDETQYGLRTWLRRDGTYDLFHRLYVNTYYVPASRQISRADGMGRPLDLTGISRDPHYCFTWPTCSPFETFGALIPDALLRANRDSVTVTFRSRTGTEVPITVRRELVDAYLAAVDSVTAALRGKSRASANRE